MCQASPSQQLFITSCCSSESQSHTICAPLAGSMIAKDCITGQAQFPHSMYHDPSCCMLCRPCTQLEALKQQQNSRQGELARAQTQLEKARRLCEAAQQRKE
jgi:hypothetical protein